jgi:hypothetical protein
MTNNIRTKANHQSTHQTIDGVFVSINDFSHELASGETVDYFRVHIRNVNNPIDDVLNFRVYCNSRLGRNLAAAQPQCFNWVYRFELEIGTFIRLLTFTTLSPIPTVNTEEI